MCECVLKKMCCNKFSLFACLRYFGNVYLAVYILLWTTVQHGKKGKIIPEVETEQNHSLNTHVSICIWPRNRISSYFVHIIQTSFQSHSHGGHFDPSNTDVTHNINNDSIPGSVCVPVRLDSVTVNQHAQYKDPQSEAPEWSSASIIFLLLVSKCLQWKK